MENIIIDLSFSMLHAAEELEIRKPIKQEFGGGMKEFIYENLDVFDGVEEASSFFTSQERQLIVKHMLYNLRAKDKDEIANTKFLEGQAISELSYLLRNHFHILIMYADIIIKNSKKEF